LRFSVGKKIFRIKILGVFVALDGMTHSLIGNADMNEENIGAFDEFGKKFK
jgi:hypothetical protein